MYRYDNPLDLTHVLIFTCVFNLVRHLESSIFSPVCDPNINIKILLESSLLFIYSPMIPLGTCETSCPAVALSCNLQSCRRWDSRLSLGSLSRLGP